MSKRCQKRGCKRRSPPWASMCKTHRDEFHHLIAGTFWRLELDDYNTAMRRFMTKGNTP